jgi:quinol monooxygenase YgiN
LAVQNGRAPEGRSEWLAVRVCKWIQFKVAPQDEETLARALATLADASFHEDGCLGYEAFRCGDGTFAVLESWRDEAAFEAHRQAPHTQNFKKMIGLLSITKESHDLLPI